MNASLADTLPNFFIIGAPKCGTTALSSYLSQHPDIVFSVPEEPHFFDDDYRPEWPWWLDSRSAYSWDVYKSCFAHGTGLEKAIGEGTVFYLYSKSAVPKILEFRPEAKFIVMLRNPVEAAYSWHGQALLSFGETVEDFGQAWRLQGARAQGRNLPFLIRSPDFFQYGPIFRYGEQLERLLGSVPASQVHYVIYDDFRDDTESAYLKVLEFLLVEPHGLQEYPKLNASKRVNSVLLHFLVRQAGSVKKQIRLQSRGFGLLRRLERRNVRYAERPKLSADLRADLVEYFRADIAKTSQLINRDLSHWLDEV